MSSTVSVAFVGELNEVSAAVGEAVPGDAEGSDVARSNVPVRLHPGELFSRRLFLASGPAPAASSGAPRGSRQPQDDPPRLLTGRICEGSDGPAFGTWSSSSSSSSSLLLLPAALHDFNGSESNVFTRIEGCPVTAWGCLGILLGGLSGGSTVSSCPRPPSRSFPLVPALSCDFYWHCVWLTCLGQGRSPASI